jgi:hypothetical protein
MVRIDAPWDFYLASISEVTCSWFQKEEGLLRNSIIQLLDVSNVVSPDSDYLRVVSRLFIHESSKSMIVRQTFFPWLTNDAMLSITIRERPGVSSYVRKIPFC